MSIPSEAELREDYQTLLTYKSLLRGGNFTEALFLLALLRVSTVGGGSGGGGDASLAEQQAQTTKLTAIQGYLDNVEPLLTAIAGYVDQLEGYTDTLESSAVNQITSYPTQSTVAVGTTSAPILSANANRKHVTLFGSSAINIWLGMGVAAEVGKGIPIRAGMGYEINQSNLFKGAINAIAESGAASLAIAEGV